MNKNLWNYYKQSEDGKKAIDIFNPETENIWDNIEKIIELLKQWDINENQQYLFNRVTLYNINLVEREFVKEDDIFSREFFEHLITSHPLKTIFQHKACTDKLYADSFYKVQKNSHSSFEVICCRS